MVKNIQTGVVGMYGGWFMHAWSHKTSVFNLGLQVCYYSVWWVVNACKATYMYKYTCIEPGVAGMLLCWWLMPARSHHCIKKNALNRRLQVCYCIGG